MLSFLLRLTTFICVFMCAYTGLCYYTSLQVGRLPPGVYMRVFNAPHAGLVIASEQNSVSPKKINFKFWGFTNLGCAGGGLYTFQIDPRSCRWAGIGYHPREKPPKCLIHLLGNFLIGQFLASSTVFQGLQQSFLAQC